MSERNPDVPNPDRMATGTRFGRRFSFWVVGLAVVVLVTDFVFALLNVRDLRFSEGLVDHGNVAVRRLEHIRALVNEVALYSRGYLLVGDGEFRARTDRREGEVVAEVAGFRTFTIVPAQYPLIDRLQQQVEVAFAGVNQEMVTRPPGSLAGAEIERINRSVPATRVRMDAVRRTVEAMQTVEGGKLVEWQAAADLRLRRTLETLVAAVIVSIALIGLVLMMTLREARFQRLAAAKEARLNRYNLLLVESSGEGIYGVDLDGRCTFLNQTASMPWCRSVICRPR